MDFYNNHQIINIQILGFVLYQSRVFITSSDIGDRATKLWYRPPASAATPLLWNYQLLSIPFKKNLDT